MTTPRLALRVLVLSDLHYTTAPSNDAAGSWLTTDTPKTNQDHPLFALNDLLKDQPPIDLILCAGDICDKADGTALAQAWRELNDLAAHSGARLIATVGNHDLDSRDSKEIDPRGVLYDLSPAFPSGDEAIRDKYWARNFAIIDGPLSEQAATVPWRVATVNSSAFHGYSSKTNGPELEHGRITQRTSRRIAADLAQRPTSAVNILLVHHHFDQLPEIDTEERSQIREAEHLLSVLEWTAPWIIIHGHKHRAHIMYAHGTASSPAIFAAGSFSAFSWGKLSGSAGQNQVYVLDFLTADQLQEHDLALAASFCSWNWQPDIGWRAAAADSGIPGSGGFGWRLDSGVMARKMLAAVQATNGGVLDEQSIRDAFPNLAYLAPRDLDHMIHSMELLTIPLVSRRDAQGPADQGRNQSERIIAPHAIRTKWRPRRTSKANPATRRPTAHSPGTMKMPRRPGSTTRSKALTSFNARTMSARQVAASFIPPPAFDTLVKPTNSLLTGPRGSGKTTLLKMLQPEALSAWPHRRAREYRAMVDYTGVFVATDRTWREQLDPPNQRQHDSTLMIRTADSAFASHTMRALVMAMHCMTHRPEVVGVATNGGWRLSDEKEAQLAAKLRDVAQLDNGFPDLEGVADALTLRMAYLGTVRNSSETDESILPPWVDRQCLDMVEATIDLFNRASHQPDHQWALLFDEMEIAPTRIVTALLDAMRGQDQRMLLKVSLSPIQPEFARLQLPQSGVAGQDFESISLTYANAQSALTFSRSMLEAEVKRRYRRPLSVDDLLGPSLLSSPEDLTLRGGRRPDSRRRQTEPYRSDGQLWQTYKRLAQNDVTFRQWLTQKGADPDNLDALSPIQRANKFGKIRNIVVVREHCRADGPGNMNSHSFRIPTDLDLYSGADSLLSLVDGNPRLLKALIDELLPPATTSLGRIAKADQSRSITNLMTRVLGLIQSLPTVDRFGRETVQVFQLLTTIGKYLSYGVLEARFSESPPQAVTVDAGVPKSVMIAVELAVNAGALIHLPREARPIPKRAVGEFGVAGEQFRLSYALAPIFTLPLGLGRTVPLSTVLDLEPRTGGRR